MQLKPHLQLCIPLLRRQPEDVDDKSHNFHNLRARKKFSLPYTIPEHQLSQGSSYPLLESHTVEMSPDNHKAQYNALIPHPNHTVLPEEQTTFYFHVQIS